MNSYESEGRNLINEVMKRREAVNRKEAECFKSHKRHGIDGNPFDDERSRITRWFNRQSEKLRRKYKIK